MDNRLFNLDSRLMMCASFVQQGARLADIGTDHAYLPVWLIKNKVVSYAIASDVNQGPLNSGKITANKYNCDNIDFRLGSGIETLSKQDNIDHIVIAGMGGELICHLISANKDVINENVKFILQPMTKSEVLIKYLYNNGFEITKQKCVISGNKCYTVLLVSFTGKASDISDYFCYIGKLDLTDETSKLFIKNHINNLQNKVKGNKELLPLINNLKESI